MTKHFSSLEEFGDYLIAASEKYEACRRLTLKAIGEFTRDEARRKFGSYQEGAGPFDDWEQLAASTQKQRVQLGFAPNNPLYRTGDLAFSITYEVNVPDVIIGSDNEIMVWQELGTEYIPARSVLGLTMFESRAEYKKILYNFMHSYCLGVLPVFEKSYRHYP